MLSTLQVLPKVIFTTACETDEYILHFIIKGWASEGGGKTMAFDISLFIYKMGFIMHNRQNFGKDEQSIKSF